MRFPGQYYDAETGKHYNYFRDYDAAIGRYIESDPIGISAGTTTFSYVLQAPLNNSDATGTIGPLGALALIGGAAGLAGTAWAAWDAHKAYRDCVDNKQKKYLECKERTERELKKFLDGGNNFDHWNTARLEQKAALAALLACTMDVGRSLTDLYMDVMGHVTHLAR